MATIKDLFNKQNKDLYGLSGKAIIESRGLINPPRGAALLTSSPNALADLIGNQIGGALKGSANRPSDTIFKNNTPFSKPISLGKTRRGLQDAIEADSNYFIKKSPAPASIFAKIQQGGSTVAGTAANLAIGALNKFGSKKGLKDLKKLKDSIKNSENSELYGPKYSEGRTPTDIKKQDRVFTKWYKDKEGKLKERTADNTTWDEGNDLALNTESFPSMDVYETELKHHKFANQTWVTIKKYGTNEIIPFAGSISGISEDISPEWTNFKYVGSPFNVYRYSGVERSLKFDMKLYYTTMDERDIMIKKLNYLKSLAFPYDLELSAIKYENSANATPIAFSPNLINLSIDGLYKDVFGYVESLSFSIDDTTSWSNFNPYMEDGVDNRIYPTVVNVSFGMKIIENHSVDKGTVTRYKYNFDGYEFLDENKSKTSQIELTKESKK